MALLGLYPQFETNLMSNRKVTKLLLQSKSAKAHGKNYIKVKPHLVSHLLRNRLLFISMVRFTLLARLPEMSASGDFHRKVIYLVNYQTGEGVSLVL